MTSPSPASVEPISVAKRPFSDKFAGEVIDRQVVLIKRLEARVAGSEARVVELEAALAAAESENARLQDHNDVLAPALVKAVADEEAAEARATALLEALRECRSGWPDVGDPSHLGLLRRLDALLRTGAFNDRK